MRRCRDCKMSELEKLRQEFRSCRGPYPWRDFARLIGLLGYEQEATGATSGSRRKYFNRALGDSIWLDEPHGKEMGRGMVKRLQKHLRERRLI